MEHGSHLRFIPLSKLIQIFCFNRFLFPLLLLTSPILSSPSVPFYCRRFRGNCSVRRDNICCREENIDTTEAATEEKRNSSANENGEDKPRNITKTDSELEETLLSSASIIDEVVVAPDEPQVSF